MRKPSEYLPAAYARLRGGPMSDCSEVMRVGGRSAKVTRVGSPSAGEDQISGSEVGDEMHVLALFADFPGLEKGRLVELGGSFRLAVSVRTDPARATLSVGLSAKLDTYPAAYSGARREGGAVRNIRLKVDILAVENQDDPTIYGDAAAPSYLQSWTCCIAEDSWPELSPPQVGDEIKVYDTRSGRNDEQRMRVAAVTHNDGWWMLVARPRGGS